MEEKKLTDEDIIKALENRSGGYGAGVVGNLYEETLNLIRRLQAENEEYKWKLEDGELVSKEWHDEQVIHLQTENEELKRSKFGNWKVKFFKAQKEIERLTELHDRTLKTVEELNAKNCGLEYSVDNLKESFELANKSIEVNNKRHEEVLKQAVKDTAKEILSMFDDRNYITENELKKAIAEHYGVEVE